LGRRLWQRARAGKTRIALQALVITAVLAAAVALPAGGVASGLASRVAGRISRFFTSPGASRNGKPFSGVAAVGALFREDSAGQLGQHFCTASVVSSPAGDLALTAAHCVTGGNALTAGGTLVFVPGYANGRAPYGIWRVTAVYTDAAWQSSQDPNDDFAFLRLALAPDGVPIEDITGAETLGTSWPAHAYVRVIGYPDGAAEPVWCENWTTSFSPSQLQFDCGGYTDGTSGSPFLADASPSTGQGIVIGLIGGYHQGGDTPSVSYSAAFGAAMAALFKTAEADG
jgi:V8-like Glu-specific endopeptidase